MLSRLDDKSFHDYMIYDATTRAVSAFCMIYPSQYALFDFRKIDMFEVLWDCLS